MDIKKEAVKVLLNHKPIEFINDPGHGWYKVPRVSLVALNIHNRISEYSYQSKDGRDVYLEEDVDAQVFFNALTNVGITVIPPIINRYIDHTCFIRQLPSYEKLPIVAK